MIDRLLNTMQAQGLLLSDHEIDAGTEALSFLHEEDIADALWLAAKIGGAYAVVKPDEPTITNIEDIDIVIDNSNSIASPTVSAYIPPTGENRDAQTNQAPEKGLAIQVKSAPALPDTLAIARSLRPLMRKKPLGKRFELDVMATVNRIAERDIWVPILQRSPERWLDLELVIEASEFSFIWQDTINEFQHLLENQGAFRNVRTWYMQESDTKEPQLVVKKQQNLQGSSSRGRKELINAAGRGVVLYISDCRSPIWQQGQIHDWLAIWSKHCPTAIVQLLPERLWKQTELDVGFAVQASSLLPGAVNSQLQIHEMPTRTKIDAVDTLTLPVVTLTANALKQWALVVAAAGRQRVPARLFDLSWVRDPVRDRTATIIQPKSAAARVELFMATASEAAKKLAGMMAAVPVEMSVVRLIQQELLKDLTTVNIAEVYSSDLLEPENCVTWGEDLSLPFTELPPQSRSIRYDFAPGVRGLLNLRTPLDETFEVIDALSKRIASTLGFEIESFTALLSPKSSWDQTQKDAILPFAQITTEVLHRLGGEYAELAQLVERDAREQSGWIKPLKADQEWQFPELENLTFTTAQLVEARDETSLPLQLEPFTFKIQKSDGRANRYIEKINENISLEMVAIAGGEFMMGSPAEEPERFEDESPQHLVTVPDFYLGRYPVTQAQWRSIAILPPVNRELAPDPSEFKGDTRPVENVSWEEAIECCARLSKHTQRQYRLPTEAEWEYACRAGTTTPFNFGATISPELANYDGSAYANGPTGESRNETTPVDYFEIANDWGLCDMHGNVWEWCEDHWHENYEGAPKDGSAWLTDNVEAARVFRGGSWISVPRYCRSASRFCYDPSPRLNNLGLRMAVGAPGLF